jgi:sigma-B regulation protein RsbU (phosphoserine phosphatase)
MDRLSNLTSRWKMRRKWPKSTLGRLAAILTILAVPLYLLGRVFARISTAGWYSISFTFVLWFLGVVLVLLGYRWMRHNLMWRLRNRLIVTYVFIGVIPVVLLVAMAGIAGYLFAGQFATFVVTSDISSELKSLEASNGMIAADLAARSNPAAAAESAVNIGAAHLQNQFPGRTVTVRIGDSTVVSPSTAKPISVPSYVRKDASFSSLVLEEDSHLYLRAANTIDVKGRPITVVSSVPLNRDLLLRIVQQVGAVTVQPPDRSVPAKPESKPEPKKDTSGIQIENKVPNSGVSFRFGGQKDSSVVTFKGDASTENVRVEAGKVAPKLNRFDVELTFGTGLSVKQWDNGETRIGLLVVQTRPSTLYERLFRTLGEFSGIILSVLIGIAILFALIELVALFIGIRLTRTMTASVAQLYEATQHIETGELAHRIPVTREDQLAALERSFNSMTESLQKLIAEQKEKQRIESELAIAQEVQALLFPRDISSLESFEVHGVCKPARTVSGDYYDFLPMGPHQLGLAVGDISGKGISAALLMATVHAFVRAYTLVESVPALAAVGAGAIQNLAENSLIRMSSPGIGDLPPGTLLAMLNHQLYRSTPTEKYATMFLGVYDSRTRQFKYSNAGHLPPMIISNDGTVRALETGGLVVGLFGDVTYDDDAVQMNPGDIFLAYSDGITEPENEFGEFGEERLVALVQENRHLPLERISEIVVSAVVDWIGGQEQPDDITLVLGRAL